MVETKSDPIAAVRSSNRLTVFVRTYAPRTTAADSPAQSRLAAFDESVTEYLAYARNSAELRMTKLTMMWKKNRVLPTSRLASNGRMSSRNPGTLSPNCAYIAAAVP